MAFKIFLIFFTLSTAAHAYRPAYDVLFKNNGNPIYIGETTSAEIQIKEMSSQVSYKLKVEFSKFQKKEYFLQALFDQNFAAGEVIKVSRVLGIEGNGFSNSNNPMVYLFYGLLEMYMANNNEIIINGLQNFNINLKKSQNVVNKDQKKILEEYLYFSRKKARGRASEKDNPIRTSDPSKQAIINNILKQSFYLNDQKANLVRINQRFMWAIDEKNIKAYFDQQTRKLVTIELPEFNKLSFTPADMQVFSGYYSAPKKIVIEESGVPKYEIQLISITNFRDSYNAFQTRAANLQKLAAGQSKEKKTILAQFPSFVLQ